MKVKLACLLLLAAGCVGSIDQTLEEARFLLDRGLYAEAAAKAEEALAASPDHPQAKFLLASARVGSSSLSVRGRCQETDTGYLGLLACLSDDRLSTESSDLATFRRIAPENTDKIGELRSATDILVGLTATVTDPTFLRDVYMQLWVARNFEIAGVTTQLKSCTDAFDPNLPDDDLARFRENLEQAPGDAVNAGLPSDTGLIGRTEGILEGLNSASSAVDFFNTTFGGGC